MNRLLMRLAWLLCLPLAAHAGNGCREQQMPPAKVAAAAETALRAAVALEEMDAPVALIARVGTDLSSRAWSTATPVSWSAIIRRDAGRWCICSTSAAVIAPDCTPRDW